MHVQRFGFLRASITFNLPTTWDKLFLEKLKVEQPVRIPRLLRNPTVHYDLHNKPQLLEVPFNATLPSTPMSPKFSLFMFTD